MEIINQINIHNTSGKKREEISLFVSVIISIFPISFIINSFFIMMRQMRNIDNLKEALLGIIISLLICFGMIIAFTLDNYIHKKAPQFYLLFVLGIKKCDFWKLIFQQFLKSLLLFGTVGILLNNLASIFLVICIKYKEINLKEIIATYFFSSVVLFMILVLVAITVIGILYYHNRKKKSIEFWNKMEGNTEYIYNVRGLYYLKPICGGITGMAALLCCFSYQTLYVAALLQVIAFYFFISSSECFRYMNQRKKYKKIISHTSVVCQFKENIKLVLSIYLLHFIAVFIVGGIILSCLSEKAEPNYTAEYPYECVIWGKNFVGADSLKFSQVKTQKEKNTIAISTSTYEKITDKEVSLSDTEIVYISQTDEENFAPLENENSLTVWSDEKEATYSVKESRWEIIFGENVPSNSASDVTDIIVMNDKEYNKFSGNSDEYDIWVGNFNKVIEGENLHKWSRAEIIKEKIQLNDYLLLIMSIVGVMFVLEEQGIVWIKIILNQSILFRKYNLLYVLGIKKRDMKKFMFHEIKEITFVPAICGTIAGLVFLALECFYQDYFTGDLLKGCLGIGVAVILIQYVGSKAINEVLLRTYATNEQNY